MTKRPQVKFTLILVDADFNRLAEGAFPAPDRGIRDYLLSAPYTTDFHAKMHHMIFLGAIFKVIKDELEKSINVYDRDSLAKWWHSHLAEPGARTRVYSQIVTEARETVRAWQI